MASGPPIKQLCDETTCPICLGYFKDPVILDCGHNFCRACLTQCWGKADTGASCPQCRETFQQRNFKPNRQLANLVDLVKKLPEGKQEERKSRLCKKHQEPFKLFCKNDEAPICLVCDKAKEHKGHNVIPMEEAAQEYKEKIQGLLEPLEKWRRTFLSQKMAKEQSSQECLGELEVQKQNTRTAFEQMQKSLEEKESLWMGQLENLEKEIKAREKGNISRLTEEISRLNDLITEMEGKCRHQATEFLQDIKGAMSRYKNGQVTQKLNLSPGLDDKLRIYCQKISILKNTTMEKCKVNVTLDPETAHPKLVLSEDLKNVKCESQAQDLPDNPKRFDLMTCVLGEGVLDREDCSDKRFKKKKFYRSLLHKPFFCAPLEEPLEETLEEPCLEKPFWKECWWEVVVEEEVRGAMWAVGVAKGSVTRKGKISLSTGERIWAIGKRKSSLFSPSQLYAFTSPEPTPLTPKREPRKIRVCLKFDTLEFLDADTNKSIFTFPYLGLSSERRIFPYFWVESGVSLTC